MSEEDKRAAVSISINLSTQLIAAALATLAVQGAYASYALGDRAVRPGFTILCIISAILLVASIFVAGKGITEARNSGYEGRWELAIGKKKFNGQAILCLAALLVFGVTLLRSGPPKSEDLQTRTLQLAADMQRIHEELSMLGAGHSAQEKSISEVQADLSRIRGELQTPDRTLQE